MFQAEPSSGFPGNFRKEVELDIWIAALFIETAAGKIGYCALPVVEDQCSIFVILWKTLPKAQQTQISSGFIKKMVYSYPTSQILEILKHKV